MLRASVSLARRLFGFAALQSEPDLGFGKFLLGVADAALEMVDLGAHRHQFDLTALRHHRTVGQFDIEPGKVVLLVLERLLGVAQRFGLGGKFLFGGAKLFLHRLLASFQRKDGGVLLAEFELHAIDRVGLLAEFGELAGGLVLELIDAHLEPARRHREFGAKLILVGLDFGHRQRRRRLQPSRRQAHRAVMHQRQDHQPDQHRDQKTDRQIHDRFDHEDATPADLQTNA